MVYDRARERSESVSSQKDRLTLTKKNSQIAIDKGKDPIKITWKNLSYTVGVATTKYERA